MMNQHTQKRTMASLSLGNDRSGREL
jgi:hypothetical protein